MSAKTPAKTFDSILIANRGEIAIRVMRTAAKLGYRTIAIYSDADADAPHVGAADDAVRVGESPVAESYLHAERILAAAKATGAGAIHPGYGFLSENAEFARACEKAGLVFIGPPADAIDIMGNKAAAKRKMIAAEVPCVPGYQGEDQNDDAFRKAAAQIGYPVMVKAAAGGGGRGMRIVASEAELKSALDLARSEAQNAFGSGELILEKAIVRPRHVEIQVFADAHGNVVHLGERDCSVQRRHQKVVEEAPCPVMTTDLRERMGAAAVEATRAIGYRGAGTIEFLLDETGEFYFLEMNTRLQVEHPVTEMITGLDLVAMQIGVAGGESLGISQNDVTLTGHAIEVRLYAEDPAHGFLPCTGDIEQWIAPTGDGVRVDAGIETGGMVSPFYDPMLAKVVAWGPTRDTARRRLIGALQHTAVFGPRTNRDFLIAVLGKDAFVRGEATTAFIAEQFPADALEEQPARFTDLAIAAVLQFEHERDTALATTRSLSPSLANWSSSGRLVSRYRYTVGDSDHDIAVSPSNPASYDVTDGERTSAILTLVGAGDATEIVVDGRKRSVLSQILPFGRLNLSAGGRTYALRNLLGSVARADEAGGGGTVRAPMHGMLLELNVSVGDNVRRGERLAVLEAMKMQHEITASIDGRVVAVSAKAGTQVAADDILLEIEAAEG
jgi:geranyl-CoA carboxylase alpha subunit